MNDILSNIAHVLQYGTDNDERKQADIALFNIRINQPGMFCHYCVEQIIISTKNSSTISTNDYNAVNWNNVLFLSSLLRDFLDNLPVSISHEESKIFLESSLKALIDWYTCTPLPAKVQRSISMCFSKMSCLLFPKKSCLHSGDFLTFFKEVVLASFPFSINILQSNGHLVDVGFCLQILCATNELLKQLQWKMNTSVLRANSLFYHTCELLLPFAHQTLEVLMNPPIELIQSWGEIGIRRVEIFILKLSMRILGFGIPDSKFFCCIINYFQSLQTEFLRISPINDSHKIFLSRRIEYLLKIILNTLKQHPKEFLYSLSDIGNKFIYHQNNFNELVILFTGLNSSLFKLLGARYLDSNNLAELTTVSVADCDLQYVQWRNFIFSEKVLIRSMQIISMFLSFEETVDASDSLSCSELLSKSSGTDSLSKGCSVCLYTFNNLLYSGEVSDFIKTLIYHYFDDIDSDEQRSLWLENPELFFKGNLVNLESFTSGPESDEDGLLSPETEAQEVFLLLLSSRTLQDTAISSTWKVVDNILQFNSNGNANDQPHIRSLTSALRAIGIGHSSLSANSCEAFELFAAQNLLPVIRHPHLRLNFTNFAFDSVTGLPHPLLVLRSFWLLGMWSHAITSSVFRRQIHETFQFFFLNAQQDLVWRLVAIGSLGHILTSPFCSAQEFPGEDYSTLLFEVINDIIPRLQEPYLIREVLGIAVLFSNNFIYLGRIKKLRFQRSSLTSVSSVNTQNASCIMLTWARNALNKVLSEIDIQKVVSNLLNSHNSVNSEPCSVVMTILEYCTQSILPMINKNDELLWSLWPIIKYCTMANEFMAEWIEAPAWECLETIIRHTSSPHTPINIGEKISYDDFNNKVLVVSGVNTNEDVLGWLIYCLKRMSGSRHVIWRCLSSLLILYFPETSLEIIQHLTEYAIDCLFKVKGDEFKSCMYFIQIILLLYPNGVVPLLLSPLSVYFDRTSSVVSLSTSNHEDLERELEICDMFFLCSRLFDSFFAYHRSIGISTDIEGQNENRHQDVSTMPFPQRVMEQLSEQLLSALDVSPDIKYEYYMHKLLKFLLKNRFVQPEVEFAVLQAITSFESQTRSSGLSDACSASQLQYKMEDFVELNDDFNDENISDSTLLLQMLSTFGDSIFSPNSERVVRAVNSLLPFE